LFVPRANISEDIEIILAPKIETEDRGIVVTLLHQGLGLFTIHYEIDREIFGVEFSLEKGPEFHITYGDENTHQSSLRTGIQQTNIHH